MPRQHPDMTPTEIQQLADEFFAINALLSQLQLPTPTPEMTYLDIHEFVAAARIALSRIDHKLFLCYHKLDILQRRQTPTPKPKPKHTFTLDDLEI